MIFLCLGKTISGLPGKSVRFFLNRKPSPWTIDLTSISGRVSLFLTRAIIQLRLDLSNLSKAGYTFEPFVRRT